MDEEDRWILKRGIRSVDSNDIPNTNGNNRFTGRNLKDKGLVEEIAEAIGNLPGLTITLLTIEDVTQATKLMVEYDLDYEDTLHLATG
ncbi:MAG: hypothetical protein QXQ29_03935 [Candidatus Bathyarchaeia archaeon]